MKLISKLWNTLGNDAADTSVTLQQQTFRCPRMRIPKVDDRASYPRPGRGDFPRKTGKIPPHRVNGECDEIDFKTSEAKLGTLSVEPVTYGHRNDANDLADMSRFGDIIEELTQASRPCRGLAIDSCRRRKARGATLIQSLGCLETKRPLIPAAFLVSAERLTRR
jgi:hypothetical protein